MALTPCGTTRIATERVTRTGSRTIAKRSSMAQKRQKVRLQGARADADEQGRLPLHENAMECFVTAGTASHAERR